MFKYIIKWLIILINVVLIYFITDRFIYISSITLLYDDIYNSVVVLAQLVYLFTLVGYFFNVLTFYKDDSPDTWIQLSYVVCFMLFYILAGIFSSVEITHYYH